MPATGCVSEMGGQGGSSKGSPVKQGTGQARNQATVTLQLAGDSDGQNEDETYSASG